MSLLTQFSLGLAYLSLQEDEVVDCFHTIVSHGHLGAQKYLNSLAHPICHLFARKFEKNGYVSPVV